LLSSGSGLLSRVTARFFTVRELSSHPWNRERKYSSAAKIRRNDDGMSRPESYTESVHGVRTAFGRARAEGGQNHAQDDAAGRAYRGFGGSAVANASVVCSTCFGAFVVRNGNYRCSSVAVSRTSGKEDPAKHSPPGKSLTRGGPEHPEGATSVEDAPARQ
jgi:hypothetical protein